MRDDDDDTQEYGDDYQKSEESVNSDENSSYYNTGGYGGGYSQESEMRMTPTQKNVKYMLEPDDIPESIKKKFWGISSRHLELIDIPEYRYLARYERDVRDILRTSLWSRDLKKIPYRDVIQMEFYATKVLLPKSLNRGERKLLVTTYNSSDAGDYGERTPMTGMNGQAAGSGLASMFKLFMGGR